MVVLVTDLVDADYRLVPWSFAQFAQRICTHESISLTALYIFLYLRTAAMFEAFSKCQIPVQLSKYLGPGGKICYREYLTTRLLRVSVLENILDVRYGSLHFANLWYVRECHPISLSSQKILL